ncbi:rCG58180 [Rattus norvegicus]|uniref:RCG58180 n=1 Tax=Rattus norvegicus TaxID=10116 RepID=A6J504_RAT|nr:rCG58180 [Rattus norvegicus]
MAFLEDECRCVCHHTQTLPGLAEGVTELRLEVQAFVLLQLVRHMAPSQPPARALPGGREMRAFTWGTEG